MKVLVTGATGFVGRNLCRKLLYQGHLLHILTRDEKKFPYPCKQFQWTRGAPIDPRAFVGVEAVVHLAGAPIVGKRWSVDYKKKLYDSRVQRTRHLVEGIQKLAPQVKTFVSASAIGYYGDTGDRSVTEEEKSGGDDFLAHLCQSWEKEGSQLKGVRTVIPRMGLVLGRGGGLLHRLNSLFRWGLGAPLGNAKHWMSWIHMDDLVEFLCESLVNTSFQGIYNLTSPTPVSNRQFMDQMGSVLHRFVAPPVPYLGLYLTQGEVARYMVASQKVLPQRLLEQGFSFKYPRLSEALSHLLPQNPYDEEWIFDQWLKGDPGEVFDFFSDVGNLEKVTPPWLKLNVIGKSTPKIQSGTLIDYKLRVYGCPITWRTKIKSWTPPYSFSDIQIKGPYRKWEHTHRFEPLAGGTLMTDEICVQIPMSYLLGFFVRKDIDKIFSYRSCVIKELFSKGFDL